MYNGKRVNPKTAAHAKRKATLLVSLVLILTMGIGATLAFLVDSTDDVENVFEPGRVPPTVVEEFDGDVKNNVAVKNNGNVDAFIRVAVVANWVEVEVDEDGDPVLVDGKYVPTGNIAPVVPVKDTDYEWTTPEDTKWFYKDGYYYYSEAVASGENTENLFTNCKLEEGVTPPEGYQLSIEILAQTIHAEGMDSEGKRPVEEQWKVTYTAPVPAQGDTPAVPATIS